jgi:two-component system, cell cycle sensor histidine kinase DivJ
VAYNVRFISIFKRLWTKVSKYDEINVQKVNDSLYFLHFETASTVAQETNAMALILDRTAYVHELSPNAFNVLQLKQYEVKQTAFLNRVHVSDKVILLSHLDDVANGKPSSKMNIRLAHGGSYNNKEHSFKNLSCSLFALGDKIMMILKVVEPVIPDKIVQPTGIGKSAFSMVSHELRTPLNAIIGFSDLMKKGLAGEIANDKQRQYISFIHQSGEQLLELISSILDLSKLENGTFELEVTEFLPQQTIENVTSILASNAHNKEIKLNYLPLCGLEEFCGDHRVVQQIITNLLSNAVKFTKQGGKIDLSVNIDGDKLIIQVTDSGIGMTKEELIQVSQPFYQASKGHNRSQEGAGLGLALVRRLALLHGGGVEITSEKNVGTSVRVVVCTVHPLEKNASFFGNQTVNPIEIYGSSDVSLRKIA